MKFIPCFNEQQIEIELFEIDMLGFLIQKIHVCDFCIYVENEINELSLYLYTVSLLLRQIIIEFLNEGYSFLRDEGLQPFSPIQCEKSVSS